MLKTILALLFSASSVLAQKEYFIKDSTILNYLSFSPSGDELISYTLKKYCNKSSDSCFSKDFVTIYSSNDGEIIKEIALPEDYKKVFLFSLSHDGLSFIIAHKDFMKSDHGPFKIYKYLLNENRWDWEEEWYFDEPCLRMTYSADNKQIICVTASKTIIIDSESGKLIFQSNSISNYLDYEKYFSRIKLSKNGRYFAFWDSNYYTFSANDEAGFSTLIDFLWYGIRWLFHFGKIPNYLYVWDIYNDELLFKIEIPFEIREGDPAFTDDEEELIIGSFDGKYSVYSIIEKQLIREFVQKESIEEEKSYYDIDVKKISPNKNYFATSLGYEAIILVDYTNGQLLKNFDDTNSISSLFIYPMAFSTDSKYFAIFEERNKLSLYETNGLKLLWEKEYRPME